MNITPIPQNPATPTLDLGQLRPDCGNCFALCCTAFGFTRSADFAIDKPAGTPCRNLGQDFSCTIHDRLRPRGFSGCTVFDCFGAGQAVSQRLFGGVSWRENPNSQQDMFAAFKSMRQLHEMLWHLAEAQARTFDPYAAADAKELAGRIEAIAGGTVPGLLNCDMESLHGDVRRTLMEISDEVRAAYFADGGGHLDPDLQPGADLMGANLRQRRLCGADLRGAYLIGADLRGANLAGVDLLGADLRDARVDCADLSAALFLTQPQLNSATGNRATALPPRLSPPSHWAGG